MNDLLIAVRFVHIASTAALAGTIFFAVFIVSPVLRAGYAATSSHAYWRRLAWIAWISLGASVVSGAVWLFVLAADISDQSLRHVIFDNVVWKILTQTRLGVDWMMRLGAAMVLAGGGLVAVSIRALPASRLFDVVLAVLAMVYCGGLAWAGHASGTPGFIGSIHRAADVLHLLAASAWIGGLVPLALLLAGARHTSDLTFAAEATQRFSTLGLIAVGTVLLTGALNAYILVGSIPALTDTEYGRLLSVKIGVFVVMVFIAAINRLRLAPGLTSLRNGAISARQLQRNSLIEAALGLAIVGIVGALGALPPGAHVHAM